MVSRGMNLIRPIRNATGDYRAFPRIGRGTERSYSITHVSNDGEHFKGNANINRGYANPNISQQADTDTEASQPQGLDPSKGWEFRGVYKAIICGRVERAPEQKLLGSGRTVTVFSVSTGGMFDHRNVVENPARRPLQWHKIAVHNEWLAGYAVQHLMKGATVYVEGDIETRVYNDDINGMVKRIPEICIRRDGQVQLINAPENLNVRNMKDDIQCFRRASG